MDILSQYHQFKENRLTGRYISLDKILPLLTEIESKGYVKEVGISEENRPIHSVAIGSGSKKVLGWSQMHGNESTTTKALFDFFSLLQNPYLSIDLLNNYTFLFIPMLNPDGAHRYTRENANGIDLNRDAQEVSQSESRILRRIFNEFKPDLCLNLHDQRTIYGLSNNRPATLSFLAPAADKECSITASREKAMADINRINRALQDVIPGQIGRYDDSFNPNCVGDTFQALDVPTILFEAGHYPGDYQREKTRELLFYSLWALFTEEGAGGQNATTIEAYFEIPENEKNFKDIILRNVLMDDKTIDIAIQYTEVLERETINFQPIVNTFGDLKALNGHKEVDLKGAELLINSHENVFVDEKIVTITHKYSKKPIIF